MVDDQDKKQWDEEAMPEGADSPTTDKENAAQLGEDAFLQAFSDEASKPFSLEDLFRQHGLDIESPSDLDAMQDFSFAAPTEETAENTGEKPAKKKKARKSKAVEEPENLIDADVFGEPVFSAPSPVQPSRELPAEDPAEDPFAWLMNDKPLFEEPRAKAQSNPDPADETIFESSAFDDVNLDFPEDNRAGDNLGETPLFDYEPQATLAEDNASEAAADQNDDAAAGAPPSSGVKKWLSSINKRHWMRLGMAAALVIGVYFMLNVLIQPQQDDLSNVTLDTEVTAPPAMTDTTTTASVQGAQDSNNPVASVTAPDGLTDLSVADQAPSTANSALSSSAASAPAPTLAATATESAPATTPAVPANAPAVVTPPAVSAESAVSAPAVVAPPAASAEPAAVATTTTPAAPAVTVPPVAYAAPAANTALPVSLPTTSLAQALPSAASADDAVMAQKLEQLDSTLKALDSRLNQLQSPGADKAKLSAMSSQADDSMQADLNQALKQMNSLNKKMDRLSELQQQLRALDTEVRSLKQQVTAQTGVMAEEQRLYQDNLTSHAQLAQGPAKMFVQAVIPGRAWLRSELGELTTVIPGDEVPGYGRVVSIDATSGTVVMSSRAVFREQ